MSQDKETGLWRNVLTTLIAPCTRMKDKLLQIRRHIRFDVLILALFTTVDFVSAHDCRSLRVCIIGQTLLACKDLQVMNEITPQPSGYTQRVNESALSHESNPKGVTENSQIQKERIMDWWAFSLINTFPHRYKSARSTAFANSSIFIPFYRVSTLTPLGSCRARLMCLLMIKTACKSSGSVKCAERIRTEAIAERSRVSGRMWIEIGESRREIRDVREKVREGGNDENGQNWLNEMLSKWAGDGVKMRFVACIMQTQRWIEKRTINQSGFDAIRWNSSLPLAHSTRYSSRCSIFHLETITTIPRLI